MLLRWMDESGISGDDTLIAFDFDFTLKGAPNPLTQESEVRDKEHTLAALRELQRRNANMIIVTARQAHHTAWEGVRHRVHSLGLHEFIGKVCVATSCCVYRTAGAKEIYGLVRLCDRFRCAACILIYRRQNGSRQTR